jgi:hypothetical protein
MPNKQYVKGGLGGGNQSALQHRGMLPTTGLFNIIFVSADHFLFYVV